MTGGRPKPLFAFYVEDLDNEIDLSLRAAELQRQAVITPWLWDRALESSYGVGADEPDAPPAGPEVSFPDFTRRGTRNRSPGQPVPAFSDLRTPGRAADDPETDWRGLRTLSLVAQAIDSDTPDADDRAWLNRLAAGLLTRVDLNTSLPSYPHQQPFTTPAHRARTLVAQVARQQTAEDLYRRLLVVTGTPPVADAAIADPPDQDLATRRPAELLSVSGVRPHQLTHRFVTTPPGAPAEYAHRAPWFDEDLAASDGRRSHRLYRLCELVRTADRSVDGDGRGRAPGTINLNTVFDFEAFLPLFGAGADAEAVREIWTRLLELRSPRLLDPEPSLSEADRPFLSSDAAMLPASDPQGHGRGVNIDDTIFRAWDPGAPGDQRRLFDADGENDPYLRSRLLTALYNRLTTRSNVFAVWLTVGFFEVVDETMQPVCLGEEIGQADGRQIRHRFFAIVDRTNLQLFGVHTTRAGTEVTRYLTRSDARDGAVPFAGHHWVRLETLEALTATEQRDASGARLGPFFTFKAERLSRLRGS